MKLELGTAKKFICPRQIGALALLALFLSVLGMAQFESLHRTLHADAAEPEHQCAVTLIQAGQIDTPSAPAALPVVPAELICQATVQPLFLPQPEFALLPSRGPPALS